MSNKFLSSPNFKLILLTAMVLQNSSTVLVGRYTRSSVKVEELYAVDAIIMSAEIGKLVLSCVLEHFTTNGQLIPSIRANIIEQPHDALKIMIPALLYLVQNSLLYVALSNLTAPVFQVTYQTKLVTTAVVSVMMLNRKYNFQQWICLVVLSLGVAIVVLGESSSSQPKVITGEQSLTVGLVSVTISCLSSALAGVYFEKVVKTASGEKQRPVSVWMRNIQLAFFTICLALVQSIFKGDFTSADSKSYLHGFTFWVWVLVLLQSAGGLLVAAIIKYADNVLKGLATGVSVCFATGVSTVLFGTPLKQQFVLGAGMILGSVYVFSNPISFKKSFDTATVTETDPKIAKNESNDEMEPILPR